MLGNCTDLEMIIEFAEEKEEFLKKYTELESIPCLSTISNILQVESFHWLLDMNYNEDDSRVSNVNSQKCLNVIFL